MVAFFCDLNHTMVNVSLEKLDNITKKGDTYSIETKHTNGIKTMNAQTLIAKWENLIKQETGEVVKCSLNGEDKLNVKCSELGQFFVNGFFAVYGKKCEFVNGGLFVELD